MKEEHSLKTANQLLKEQSIEAILTAAGACYLEKGLKRTTVDDIAATAGVGRATVFRNFKNKETIFTEFVQRECRRVTERIAELLEKTNTPEEYITSLLLFIICESPKEQLYKIGSEDSRARLHSTNLNFFDLMGDQLLDKTLPRIYDLAKDNGKLRDDVTLEIMILWIKRLCISFVQNPMTVTDKPEEIESYINALVVPSLFKDQ